MNLDVLYRLARKRAECDAYRSGAVYSEAQLREQTQYLVDDFLRYAWFLYMNDGNGDRDEG